MSQQNTQNTLGRLQAWRVRWFGQADPIEKQLADLERQGSGMARLAHGCAMLLVILFSAGSLITLCQTALDAVTSQWQASRTVDIPDAVLIAVSFLMVVACDVAMLYAASKLRVLSTRRAPFSERLTHIVIMLGVAIVEFGTFADMSFTFDHPVGFTTKAIVLARAAAAPILAIYLSMARPLPVSQRDIMSEAELASGTGVLRDIVREASNTDLTLAEKVALFQASTQGLDALVAATRTPTAQRTSIIESDPPNFPTGGGTPQAGVRTPKITAQQQPSILRLEPPLEWGDKAAAQAGGSRANTRRVRTPRKTSRATVEKKVRQYWKPGMSVTQLERAAGISRNAAGKWRKVLIAEAQEPVSTEERLAQ